MQLGLIVNCMFFYAYLTKTVVLHALWGVRVEVVNGDASHAPPVGSCMSVRMPARICSKLYNN